MPLRFRILAPARADGADPAASGPLVARDLEVSDAPDELRVGRHAEVELPLPFAVLSGVHARLRREGGGWTVEDAGSTNGTWLDDVRLAPGERRLLVAGAELRLATVRLRFEGGSPTAPGAEGTATIARRLVDDLLGDGPAGAPTLRVTGGAPPQTLALALSGRAYLVGRAESGALCLPVEEVSREHAAFVRGPAGVVVRDLGSKNGVLVNGVAITGERVLSDGDTLEIGPVSLTFGDPAARYLRDLERLPPDATPAAISPPLTPTPPPAAAPAPTIEPAPVEPSPSPRPRLGSTRLIVVVAVAALVLLAVAAVAISL